MNPYHYTIENTLGFFTKNDQKNDQLIWNILNLYEKLHQKYLKLIALNRKCYFNEGQFQNRKGEKAHQQDKGITVYDSWIGW